MLVEDSAAFIERLEVAPEGSEKHRGRIALAEVGVLGARWEVQLAESATRELVRLAADEPSPGRIRALQRELGAIRKHLHATQDELAVAIARLDRLQAKLQAHDERHPPHVAFRLHSAEHHIDCSESRFGRLAGRQLQRPVFVMKRDGRVWWWYLNRCWWIDENLLRREFEELVLRRDLQRMLESDVVAKARIAIPGKTEGEQGLPVPNALHLSVWAKYRGRCVDCGSGEHVNFDRIIATPERRSETSRNFELRCRQCRDRRDHNESRARVGRARVDAVAYERFG